MTQRPHQQRQAEDPVDRDHDRGEDGVAREGRRLRATGDRQREDQRHLDHGDGHGEDQRPERLTHTLARLRPVDAAILAEKETKAKRTSIDQIVPDR